VVPAFALWLVLPVGALTASVPPAHRGPAQPGLPWLAVHDAKIVDDQGRTVLLRGFNDDALIESNSGPAPPAPLDSTDATIMQTSGFNVVRLPIVWSLLEPARGQFDAAYLEHIVDAVTLLNAHGMYVVLDMHFLGWSATYGGSGAPAWATVAGIPDPHWGPMPSILRLLSPAINVSTAYFWVTGDWQAEYLKTWQHVAARFRDNSGVAGYDLINEPHSFPLPPFRFDKDQLWPFYAHAIDAVGAVDPNHLFFLDNDMAGDIPTTVVPLSAPGVVYAPHVYTGALIPPDFTGDPQPLREHVDELAREANTVPAALWFGEFSINFDHMHSAQWVTAALDAFDDHHAGWAWWQWREAAGWGIRSADGKRINTSFLKLLARPYLAAAPSGVTADHGDGVHGSLAITAPAARGEGAIEVAWPEYSLGAPRVWSDCGATASWDKSTVRAVISVPPGVGCHLTLTAAP
jgi:endoglycosylceramidase